MTVHIRFFSVNLVCFFGRALLVGGPGWTLAASLDMTDPTQNCPSAWDERTESGKRVCFRQPSGSAGCNSVTFSSDGKEYTTVIYMYVHF